MSSKLKWCASVASIRDSTILQAADYVDFVLKLVLAVGVAFVLPVFVVLLNLSGVLPGRTVVAGWRVVILSIVLLCAIATPAADVMSMFLLAIPMTALFATAAGAALLHDRAVTRRNAPGAVSSPDVVGHRPDAPPSLDPTVDPIALRSAPPGRTVTA